MVINLVPEGSLRFRWKLLIVALLFIAIAQGWIISLLWDTQKRITPQPYSFTDTGNNDVVSAKGTWKSDFTLPFPIQSSEITCYRVWGYCAEALGEMSGDVLIVSHDRHKITAWTKDSIETSNEYGCNRFVMRLDRRAQTVTETRSYRSGKNCEHIDGPSYIMKLSDGTKVWQEIREAVGKR